jgi:hypothetical protein
VANRIFDARPQGISGSAVTAVVVVAHLSPSPSGRGALLITSLVPLFPPGQMVTAEMDKTASAYNTPTSANEPSTAGHHVIGQVMADPLVATTKFHQWSYPPQALLSDKVYLVGSAPIVIGHPYWGTPFSSLEGTDSKPNRSGVLSLESSASTVRFFLCHFSSAVTKPLLRHMISGLNFNFIRPFFSKGARGGYLNRCLPLLLHLDGLLPLLLFVK